ncbi:DUF6153 family protein [Schumannella sp. 10F1B-5-1]|uniref:DUF6153 family protein n=1 Tax=Schumannella sp. 10F1B-5-1 TaxID=2590780 RepID=UPI0011318745|nr:DUF6153 family protein [Schumannella sp. 10F1B-5-1]
MRVAVLVALVIAGILGMHVLAAEGSHAVAMPTAVSDSDSESASSTAQASMSHAATVNARGASSGLAADASGGACAGDGCGDPMGDHLAMAMVCVLALLLSIVIVAAPTRGAASHLPAVAHGGLGGSGDDRRPRPDLVSLGISRT